MFPHSEIGRRVKLLVLKELRKKNTMQVNGYLVTNILQNIFFIFLMGTKNIHTHSKMRK